MTETACHPFAFRPWVRRAGLSIVVVAAVATAAVFVISERAVWIYVAVLWLGGLRVFLGTFRPIAEVREEQIVLRPLHQFVTRRVRWQDIRGTEQSGDRLIIYFDTQRGMRFVALNLNLVKGRRDFLVLLESHLMAMGFAERMVDRSRYLSRK